MKTALTIEDDAVTQILFQHMLDDRLQVHAAYTAREAVRAMIDLELDYAIVDIQLPNVDGFEVIKRLRQLMRKGYNPNLKIIILTACVSDSYRREADNLGITTYLTKPLVKPDELLEALDLVYKNDPNPWRR